MSEDNSKEKNRPAVCYTLKKCQTMSRTKRKENIKDWRDIEFLSDISCPRPQLMKTKITIVGDVCNIMLEPS